ncbi:oxalate-binding protein (plasmid) [Antarctobacter heliothermus]|uniref:Oxalate-binding protein n=1 Tax=Antarctobacter heliothermus TaxID=74033 RepID=A0A222EAY6_9RHOB|nr:cupin domain-containing protein [Antarctobacter heliothermus]ASP23359.1 oxalate-binding protein [Antarctobacter heliothermus]MBT52055.1 cupin domain-containing protein [Mameliella sp.]|tara:strand:- start:578 stop:943 length:366 start_codon:yes stop_codon:yes gene_type:complete
MTERKSVIRNIAEVPWKEFPNHFGGALSKPLVDAEGLGAQHVDHRISCYEPMAYVALHTHKVQEQIYHVLSGEGLFEHDGEKTVVRAHDVIFIPPGVEHAFYNTGLDRLVFLVITSPPSDD